MTHVAHTPSNSALLTGSAGLVGLAFDAKLHDVVTTDGAVVYHDVPSPQRNSVPL